MKFSIIIPVHNAQATLKRCLESVFALSEKDREVIVVDDCSSDDSVAIAKATPCRIIKLEKNHGCAGARNAGAEASQGGILIFVDADVILAARTLERIEEDFQKYPSAAAVTSLLSKHTPDGGFFSQYKNLYMNYIFRQCPNEEVDFLYGSFSAIRRNQFCKFDSRFALTDDTELGLRMSRLGRKVILNRQLEVTHLKSYRFPTLVKNDFWVPFWWAHAFFLHRGWETLLDKGGFAHSRFWQLQSIGISCVALGWALFAASGFLKLAGLLIFAALFFHLNRDFFDFLRREKGRRFAFVSAAFTWLDQCLMAFGVMAGTVHYVCWLGRYEDTRHS